MVPQPVSSLMVPGPIVHFSLGAVAGGAGAFAAYPLDYIKSQMQSEEGKTKYKNGADAFCKIALKDPLQLFRGVKVQMLGIAPEKAIKLAMNNMINTMILVNLGHLPLWGEVLAGSLAGASQVIATSPLEVIKTGLQTSDMTIDEIMEEIGGIKGLYNGVEACMLRDVIFTAVLFPLYTHSQAIFPAFVAGSLSGSIAAFIATPPDFIKTRMLSQDATVANRKQIASVTNAAVVATTSSQLFNSVQMDKSTRLKVDKNGVASITKGEAVEKASSSSPSLPGSPIIDEFDYLKDRNPFVVGYKIAQKEGAEVLFSGVVERSIGGIPRFGVTLTMFDFLEAYAKTHGWL
eukprot:CAMPEP_0195303170 /NCGR_PEP_ID=MMETSP0707-20130614/32362_1 /TAXON_ID=33640 /ORGANISM="Asterionellopsis glacialis, Strain CCMP134" /LENGTH=346 /DNA_ID=CAMNT_0040366637 /DNA_START=188 /DNA_END=1228 /DNA_ORIENTATION=+